MFVAQAKIIIASFWKMAAVPFAMIMGVNNQTTFSILLHVAGPGEAAAA
jgi:hypothetical protein